MKKHLLVGVVLGLGTAAFAQGSYNSPSSITLQKPGKKANDIAIPYQKSQATAGAYDSFESIANSSNTTPQNNAKAILGVTIGTTQYQNQTNASIQNRIVKNADGTISTSWTFANATASPWADRGTGYCYYNGSTWDAIPSVRLENTRVGFTNIGVTGSGKEVVITHEAPASGGAGLGTHMVSRTAKGTGAWTDAVLGATDTWPVLSIGGATRNTLHVISQSSGATTPAVPFMGQDGAITYSRSQDGGATWDKLRTVIPAIGSASYLGFGGNSYSMDAKGDTVVIVAGGFDVDVVMIKSIDNGTTWSKTIVKAFPIPLYNSATAITDVAPTDGIADTIESNDASVHVVLDKTGKAHVFFGRMRVICTTPGTGTGQGLSYFPATDGLYYWNETMGASAPVIIAGMNDYNGDNLMNIYFEPAPGTGILGYGKLQCSLTSFPSAGVDNSGRLFLTYSSLFEGLNDVGEGYDIANSTLIDPVSEAKSFRHQYVMRSDDNGTTWCAPIDITQPSFASGSGYDFHEGTYGAMAKDVDNFVHIIVQDDQAAGHGVGSTTTPSVDIQAGAANIIYYKIPLADIACGASIKENSLSSSIELYPNPASDYVNLILNSDKAAKANITVFNMVGQAVVKSDKFISKGDNTVKLDISTLNAGVYFVNAIIDGKNYNQKFIVK